MDQDKWDHGSNLWNTNRSAKDIEAKDIWSHIQINGTIGPINVGRRKGGVVFNLHH